MALPSRSRFQPLGISMGVCPTVRIWTYALRMPTAKCSSLPATHHFQAGIRAHVTIAAFAAFRLGLKCGRSKRNWPAKETNMATQVADQKSILGLENPMGT